MGLGLLKQMLPPVPVRHNNWALPGDTLKVEIMQLARINRVGLRITGEGR
jgi:hypothetical protein